MNWPWQVRVSLAAASGAALAFSFPNYNVPVLGWLSVGLLVLASYRAPLSISPLYGLIQALVFYPLSLPWIAVVVQQYGNVNPWISAGLVVLIGIAGGIILAFFSWIVAFASKKSAALACAMAPFWWVTLEFVRAHLPIFAFPWNLAG